MFFYLEPIAFLLPIPFLLYHSMGGDKRVRIKILAAYYFLSALIMLKANVMNSLMENNLDDYRLAGLLRGIFIGFYFYIALQKKWNKQLVFFFIGINLIYYITQSFPIGKKISFDSASQVIVSLEIMTLVILFMHQTLANVTEESLSLNFDFWFVTAQMLYNGGSFIIFLTYGYFTKKILEPNQYTPENRNILMQLWNGHNILLFISSIMICFFVIWIRLRKTRVLKIGKLE